MDTQILSNSQPHILIVDDDALSCQLLERVFKRENYLISKSESGEQALELLTIESFDVVLLDVMLPGINGFEVLRTVRNTPHLSNLPVILLTALKESDDIVEGLRMGANDYIVKPLNLDVIRARVATQIKLNRLLNERKQTIDELENLQETRLKFFRVVSHDLKAPLANFNMAETMLRDFVANDPTALQILDVLALTTETMQAVVDDFLDAMVVKSGQLNIQLERVPLKTVLSQAILQYKAMAANKKMKLDIDDIKGAVLADRNYLVQAMNNLVSNAIKYSPFGSSIRIWTENEEDYVQISVGDQGPGIPADEHHLLFTEFGKLSTRPTGDEGSTGMGLWIVKHLMALQNGEVGADFPPEGGSVFWVKLPVYVADDADDAA